MGEITNRRKGVGKMKNIKFYARPNGGHIHASLKCPMLDGAVFKELGYEEVALEEAQKRGLSPCRCVNEAFNPKRPLTINELIEMLSKD